MAKIDHDSILNLLIGMLGKQLVVKRSRSGKRYISAKPETDPNRKLTPAKAAYRKRFKQFAAYAVAASRHPETKKLYMEKARPGCSAYIMAWCDARYPPVVRGIIADGYHGREGNILYIHAEDDFKVASVYVSIYDGSGQVVETGEASFVQELTWTYKIKSNAKGSRIVARAYDMPGNDGIFTLDV
jgi:hypothetical protein